MFPQCRSLLCHLLTVEKNELEYVLIVIYCSASYPNGEEGSTLSARQERSLSLLLS